MGFWLASYPLNDGGGLRQTLLVLPGRLRDGLVDKARFRPRINHIRSDLARAEYSLHSRAREGSQTSSGKSFLAKLPIGLRGLEVADLLTHGSVLNRGPRRRSLVLLASGKIRQGD